MIRFNKYSKKTTGYGKFDGKHIEQWENKLPFDCPECGEKTYNLRYVDIKRPQFPLEMHPSVTRDSDGDKVLLCHLCWNEMDGLGEWDL